MVEVFRNKCLGRILCISWPNKISDAELNEGSWDAVHLTSGKENKRERWIGHVNRMPPTPIPSVAMRWTPPEIGVTTKRDVEKVRGARDEDSRVELGPDCKTGSR